MWIPTIGDLIRLTKDWPILLKADYRNVDLLNLIQQPPVVVGGGHKSITIPAGSVLKVERVYVCGSLRDYDSVTFRIVASPNPNLGAKGKTKRFFAVLSDVNKMEAEPFVP